jgi:predicted GTPase
MTNKDTRDRTYHDHNMDRIARQLDPIGGMPADASEPVLRQVTEQTLNAVKSK